METVLANLLLTRDACFGVDEEWLLPPMRTLDRRNFFMEVTYRGCKSVPSLVMKRCTKDTSLTFRAWRNESAVTTKRNGRHHVLEEPLDSAGSAKCVCG